MTSQSHLRLTETVLPAGAEWAHVPSSWGLARLAGGHGYWIGRGEAREIQPGETMVIPPAAAGAFLASQITGATLQFFSWNPELLTGVLSLSELHYFATAAQRGQAAVRVVPASKASALAFEADQGAIPLVRRSRLLQLIGEVFSPEISRHVIPSCKTVSATERFEEMINQLTGSELLTFTPAQLSQRCGCGLRHFGRLFYNRMGVSVRTHQTRLRLQKAGLLLASGDTKVIDVALESGYRNLGLFNKMFKEHTGMTPTQWRQKNSPASQTRPVRNCKIQTLSQAH
jgi:AraC-like DNA-binding protein